MPKKSIQIFLQRPKPYMSYDANFFTALERRNKRGQEQPERGASARTEDSENQLKPIITNKHDYVNRT